MLENLGKTPHQSYEYKHFINPKEREKIFNAIKLLSEYIIKNDIYNLILIDNAARLVYVGLKEYLKLKYPEKTDLKIYFINPAGFVAKENNLNENIKQSILGTVYDKKDILLKSREEISQEFQNTYTELLENKYGNTLLFDVCSHTGTTIKTVKEILSKFIPNIKVGIFHFDPQGDMDVKIDFSLKNICTNCFPFGNENLTCKGRGNTRNIYSEPLDTFKNKSKIIRFELKHIIQEEIEKNNV